MIKFKPTVTSHVFQQLITYAPDDKSKVEIFFLFMLHVTSEIAKKERADMFQRFDNMICLLFLLSFPFASLLIIAATELWIVNLVIKVLPAPGSNLLELMKTAKPARVVASSSKTGGPCGTDVKAIKFDKKIMVSAVQTGGFMILRDLNNFTGNQSSSCVFGHPDHLI